MALNEFGCLIVTDGNRNYVWEDTLVRLLKERCGSVRRMSANSEATACFAQMNRISLKTVCLGIGSGCTTALDLAARLPAAGIIALGSPFVSGWRSAIESREKRRVRQRAFGVVCPALIVHPMNDADLKPENGESLRRMLINADSVDVFFSKETRMQNLLFSENDGICSAIRVFFDKLRSETACVFR